MVEGSHVQHSGLLEVADPWLLHVAKGSFSRPGRYGRDSDPECFVSTVRFVQASHALL